jgi:hypothetical protein
MPGKPTVEQQLAAWFERSGWVQSPPDPRQRNARPLTYKRGYEARLSASPDELSELLRLLRRAGLSPGTPFQKAKRLVVPVYGREQVNRLLQLVGRAT